LKPAVTGRSFDVDLRAEALEVNALCILKKILKNAVGGYKYYKAEERSGGDLTVGLRGEKGDGMSKSYLFCISSCSSENISGVESNRRT
jgi:hypothetical protein